MKMRVLRLSLQLLVLLAVAGTHLVAADQCTNSSLNGAFGFAGMGLIPQTTQSGGLRYDPVSHVGMATYDGQGMITVSSVVQYQGKASPFTFSGTYEIKASCAGTAVLKDANGAGDLLWNFVIVNGGQEIETIAFRPAQQPRPMYSLTFTQKKR
jgi:hypothetical protein